MSTEADEIQAYIDRLRPLLGIQRWETQVTDEPPTQHCILETHVAGNRKAATIRIGSYPTLTPPQRRDAVLHELLHVWVYPFRMLMEGVRNTVGEAVWAVLNAHLWDVEETVVEEIAVAFAPLLPPVAPVEGGCLDHEH